MAEKVFVIPRQGALLRDPATRLPLPATGAEVELSAFWRRRLADGDVSLAAAPASKPKSESKPGKHAGTAKE